MKAIGRRQALALAGVASVPGMARSQGSFPDRPLTIVSPYAAGGSNDVLARAIARGMEPQLRQPVVVENVTGAGGTIGVGNVARARPDGYRLLLGGFGSVVCTTGIYGARLPYDGRTAFKPLVAMATVPILIAVGQSSPIRTLQQYVEAARGRPGEVAYGSPGVGGSLHLAAEFFQRLTRTRLEHVPYRGGAALLQDLVAGRLASAFIDTVIAYPMLGSNNLRILAVLAPQRLETMPDIPTAEEAGVSGLEIETWQGVLAPAGVSQPVTAVLERAIMEAIRMPSFAEFLRSQAATPLFIGTEEFSRMMERDFERWLPIIRDAGVQPA
jgi:tripartite-type tricarboxylate transporter receptor subunit TctC